MRTVALALMAALSGIAVGVATSWGNLSRVHEHFELNNATANHDSHHGHNHAGHSLSGHSHHETPDNKKTITATPGAKVEVVNGEDHDFGMMERFSKRSHSFVLKNIGTVPLRLENGGTSCGACTIANIDKNELQPGETGNVLVEWTAAGADPEFRKEAYVRTADSSRSTLRLVIHGKVQESILVEPHDWTVGRIAQSAETRGTLHIYSFRSEDVEAGQPSFTNTSTQENYSATIQPMPAEMLSQKTGATRGFLVQVQIQPGLPLGAITQTIRVPLNLPDVPHVDVGVHGTVAGDISVVGNTFHEASGVATLGVVNRTQGGSLTLRLVVKGPHRENVVFDVESVDPANVLKVSLGDKKAINEGAVLMHTLTIEIPPGSPPISRMGGKDPGDFGRVILRTNHPTAKEVRLLVRFAVEG